ncbi:MAG: molecular chaperone HtpG [Clostridia bacterium]|nr:molecular chaperone HtpG [Clostridia bacterium]
MAKKQFKTESKKLLEMMIHSIYTHKEIFLRELISNASDALDKLYFRSLTDSTVTQTRDAYQIMLAVDKEARTITIADNGCGMTAEELEKNLGTIAKSGSFDFKRDNEQKEDVDIIGQFGVGFYSAFMVSEKITVTSKAYGAEVATIWESTGVDGYTVREGEMDTHGTKIVLTLLADTEDEKYSEFLEEYKIRSLVKKYSDYIRYPIKMAVSKTQKKADSDEYETLVEVQTLNNMVPLWKRAQSEVSEEEYRHFYTDKFYDYEAPARTIVQKSEGASTFTALLFIPTHAPYNYYSKEYEKGLELYSSGVMIMEKCADLLPDYFSFVKGLVDSSDLSLNISREMLQHDRQLKVMARAIEKKIKNDLLKMLTEDRTKYERFFDAFGLNLKYGVYSDFGMHKEVLSDLLLFKSSKEQKYVTLKEYVEGMPEGQKAIYYASGENTAKIAMLPQVEAVTSRGYEVLYLTDEVDEFALRVMETYMEKPFKNVSTDKLELEGEEEKQALEEENTQNADLLTKMKGFLGEAVAAVKLSATLGKHPVSLASEGDFSVEMERVLSRTPGGEDGPKAQTVLQLNYTHPVFEKLKTLDDDKLATYTKILYSEARLLAGLTIDNPVEFAQLISEVMQ